MVAKLLKHWTFLVYQEMTGSNIAQGILFFFLLTNFPASRQNCRVILVLDHPGIAMIFELYPKNLKSIQI